MPLYGGRRDISLFRHINRELIGKIVDTRVDIFKVSIYDTETNLYGEALNKVYFPGVRVAGLIVPEEQIMTYEDATIDRNQSCTFYFLRDDLVKRDIFLESGDTVHWDNKYWELDTCIETKYFLARNPNTNKEIGENWGWNVSIKCTSHQTRRSTTKLEEVRAGISTQNINIEKKDDFY